METKITGADVRLVSIMAYVVIEVRTVYYSSVNSHLAVPWTISYTRLRFLNKDVARNIELKIWRSFFFTEIQGTMIIIKLQFSFYGKCFLVENNWS